MQTVAEGERTGGAGTSRRNARAGTVGLVTRLGTKRVETTGELLEEEQEEEKERKSSFQVPILENQAGDEDDESHTSRGLSDECCGDGGNDGGA